MAAKRIPLVWCEILTLNVNAVYRAISFSDETITMSLCDLLTEMS